MIVFINNKCRKEFERMIEQTAISVNYIKKEPVTGSYKGMRYRMVKDKDDMEVTIWPEPYNYITTPEEKKQRKIFPLTNEGKEEAVTWMNEQYEQQKDLWNLALHMSWV